MTAPTTFQRQTTGGTFVAYEHKPSRSPVTILVGDTTEQVFVHPEVFIREYPSIKVKALNPSGRNLYVEFDPASVSVGEGKPQLSRAINASTEAGGEIEQWLRRALDTGTPLYLALELRRKYKNGSTQQVIGYDEPIMLLRGFTIDGENTDAAQGASKDNISKVIALIGPADRPDVNLISPEVRSNPIDWETHRANRVGKTPGQGWVRVTRPDGTPGGAALTRETMRDLSGTGGGGVANIDDSTIARLADAVAVRMGAANDDPTMSRPPQRGSRSAEGKRWELFNSDGRVNPGSFAVSGLLSIRDTALTALENACYTEQADAEQAGRAPELLTREQISGTATRLMVPLGRVADDIQSAMTGKPANRVDGSAITAAKIVRQIVVRELPLTVAIVADAAAKSTWLQGVAEAGRLLAAAVIAATDDYLNDVAEPTPITDASGRARRQVQQQNEPVDPKGAPANTAVQSPPTPNFSVNEDSQAAADQLQGTVSIDGFLAKVGMAFEHVAPLLFERFGTDQAEQIDQQQLANIVSAWSGDPDRFRDQAREAWRAANKQAS